LPERDSPDHQKPLGKPPQGKQDNLFKLAPKTLDKTRSVTPDPVKLGLDNDRKESRQSLMMTGNFNE